MRRRSKSTYNWEIITCKPCIYLNWSFKKTVFFRVKCNAWWGGQFRIQLLHNVFLFRNPVTDGLITIILSRLVIMYLIIILHTIYDYGWSSFIAHIMFLSKKVMQDYHIFALAINVVHGTREPYQFIMCFVRSLFVFVCIDLSTAHFHCILQASQQMVAGISQCYGSPNPLLWC